MAQAVNVNFRMDADLKKSMEQACSELGMSMTTAFTIFAKKVSREKRIPFEVSVDPSYSETVIPRRKPVDIRKLGEAELNKPRTYTYEEFLEIIAALRSENGCPWDKVQTHESLKPCMMEEAAELLASIRIYAKTGNPENMIEELGDVLLQVVMHAQIASEEGIFTMEDVVNEVSRKMVRRHPHVFGVGNADTPDEVLVNWEEIKKEEKKEKDWIESPLQEIPKELPSLTRAVKVLKKIDKLYEKGDTYEQDVAVIGELADALKKCDPQKDNKQLEGILPELLMRISDVARIAKIPQEQALSDKIDDLIEKYE